MHDFTILVICCIMGILGGFIKSCISHNGKIKLPGQVNDYFVMGTLMDIVGGGFFGLIVANDMMYNLFGMEKANWAFSGIMGFTWTALAESLVNMFLPERKKQTLRTLGREEVNMESKPTKKIGCLTPIIPLFRPIHE